MSDAHQNEQGKSVWKRAYEPYGTKNADGCRNDSLPFLPLRQPSDKHEPASRIISEEVLEA